MDALDLMKTGFRNVHKMLDNAVDEMTAEQFNFRSAEGGITPFFSLWHYVRTEDNLVNLMIQHQDPVWLTGGYPERLGLPLTGQGTLMTDEEAREVRVEDLAAWLEYQQQVWTTTTAYLETLDSASLEHRQLMNRPNGETTELSVWFALWALGLSHGYRHVGEIEFARGLQGMGGLTN